MCNINYKCICDFYLCSKYTVYRHRPIPTKICHIQCMADELPFPKAKCLLAPIIVSPILNLSITEHEDITFFLYDLLISKSRLKLQDYLVKGLSAQGQNCASN